MKGKMFFIVWKTPMKSDGPQPGNPVERNQISLETLSGRKKMCLNERLPKRRVSGSCYDESNFSLCKNLNKILTDEC